MPEEMGAGPDGAAWPVAFEEITDRLCDVGKLLGQTIELPLYQGVETSANRFLTESGLAWIATAWLRQPKLSKRIWGELASSERVRIVHGAFVDRLHVDGNATVEGASILRRDNTRLKVTARKIILACGTIETSRLLLMPSEAGVEQPWSQLHWLGRGFNEHLDADTAVVEPLHKRSLLDTFDPVVKNGTKYSPKLFARLHLGNGVCLSGVAMLTFPGNVRNSISELAMLLRGLTPKSLPGDLRSLISASMGAAYEVLPLAARYLLHKRIGSVLRGTCTLRVAVEQPARATSRIILSKAKHDSRGVPLAQIHWEKGDDEGRAFVELTSRVKRWAEESRIARVKIDPLLEKDPAAFAFAAHEGFHHAGGTRMAISSSLGVVDSNLQVFHSHGLYCCGASVLPSSGFANPTLTAMALAVRLSDHLHAERNL
jgi:choline dehydrogenase-like flavoprotein